MGTILTPGQEPCQQPVAQIPDENYLIKDNLLSEFETEDEKLIARTNIGAVGEDVVYTRDEVNHIINEKILEALSEYPEQGDLDALFEAIRNEIAAEEFVKSDGSIPFNNAQELNALPTLSNHLTTKSYVDTLLSKHLNTEDPHLILPRVDSKLGNYAKVADVYPKQKLYTQAEVDNIVSKYVKKDGTTPFIKPLIGVDPLVDSHLTTQRYVKMLLRTHESDLDPHGLRDYIKRVLGNYYTKSETYTKAQTYSRNLLDSIINSLMKSAVENGLLEHLAAYDPHGILTEVDNRDYVKSDGSVPFSKPLKGIKATEDNELVTLELLNALKLLISNELNETVWETSGPVLTTVGFVEDNTELPSALTLQEIMDAIFYGKALLIEAPEYAMKGEKVCITIHIHGTVLVDHVVIYLNGIPVATLTSDMFTDNKYELCGLTVTEDTTWRAEAIYPDGKILDTEAVTLLSLAIFVGTLPYWENTHNNITWDRLVELVEGDSENNKFVTDKVGDNLTEIEMTYNFTDSNLRNLIVAVPYEYPVLTEIVTPTLKVGVEGFQETDTTIIVPGSEPYGMLYRVYLYKIPLVALNQTVKYKF